eukprot:TRINITY_DN32677_c0_g1_i1.p2 TRINITY_DN32677_c0_g1~~TRINITY_DN32677_c0_g1_i1.p2  ORF type:complete len:172 (+),score=80.25 TRINITY_DN32677_c0_g1_i1:49-516(+)
MDNRLMIAGAAAAAGMASVCALRVLAGQTGRAAEDSDDEFMTDIPKMSVEQAQRMSLKPRFEAYERFKREVDELEAAAGVAPLEVEGALERILKELMKVDSTPLIATDSDDDRAIARAVRKEVVVALKALENRLTALQQRLRAGAAAEAIASAEY